MYKLPKKLIIDLETWRCGGANPRKPKGLGKGATNLLNGEGYKCCLGFFCEQAGVPQEYLLRKGCPYNTNQYIQGLTQPTEYLPKIKDTHLTEECLNINDNEKTTIKEKIKLLRRALKKTGRTLIVKGTKKFKEKGIL